MAGLRERGNIPSGAGQERTFNSTGGQAALRSSVGWNELLELTHVLIALAAFYMRNNTELTRHEVLHECRIVNSAPSFI